MTTEETIAEARIWIPGDFNGKPYELRTQLFATLNPGESVRMWAPTYISYASLRSSVYGFGNSKNRKFHTKRESPDVVRVWRER